MDLNIKNGISMWEEAKKVIPGGTQLLSKRAERFLPDKWPSYFKKAKGVEIIDIDGNKFIDMTIMGVGSCILGYADDDVNKAVKKVIDDGSMCTLNSKEEVELAKLLIEIHPWAQQVRYARTGGEAMAIAVRIARAASGKDKVAFCGYHGWHDWYISCNLADDNNLDGHLLPGLDPKGIPRGLKGSSIPFEYNKIEQLRKIIEENEIGVIVLEPFRNNLPEDDFVGEVRKIADETGAVLIFDEITCGWRNNLGGIHLDWNINPDIVVYAKAISNGYPMAAILGKKNVMDSAQDTFISSTSWTERVGPCAAIATIKKLRDKKGPEHIAKIGKLIDLGWNKLAKKHDVDIEVHGPFSLVGFEFKGDDTLSTLFTQEMLKRGFLAGMSVYVSLSHTEEHVEKYLNAVDEVFELIANTNNPKSLLEGPVAYSGFKRLT
jgi:glutamate-1-semialdehyde 2,1-aminomutase